MMIVAMCLTAAALGLGRASKSEAVAARETLATFPTEIGGWHGKRLPAFDDQVLAVLGADEYVNAAYVGESGPPVGLYIGYYRTQRQGDTIHSPANCLPGSGWQPIESGRLRIPMPTQTIEVNRFVIQKGEDKGLVLYWYQSHGRVIASEYWSKFYLVADSIRLNRTDGALIRIVSPFDSSEESSKDAEARAVDLAKSTFPPLGRYLPS